MLKVASNNMDKLIGWLYLFKFFYHNLLKKSISVFQKIPCVDDSRFWNYVDKYEYVNGHRSESITSDVFSNV